MTANPVDLVYIDGVPVSKAAVRGYEKQYVRKRMANPDEVRNTVLAGQFAGVYISSLSFDFNIDVSDTTTADDGVNCVVSLDGYRFKRVAISVSETEKVVVASGDVTIADDETADNILINNTSGGPINVYLPSAAVRTKRIGVSDGAGNAGTYPITLLPKSGSGQTIMTGASYVLDVNGMGLSVRPRASGAGWY